MSEKPSIGAVIYTHELSDFWVEQAISSGIDILGLHPTGGEFSKHFLEEAILQTQTSAYQSMLHQLRNAGIQTEYEMHALSYLIPRSDFKKHPDWFRLDESGKRNPDYNACASNPEVLQTITAAAAKLTNIFRSDTHHYHFWIDDVEHAECHCPSCSALSASDQALLLYNAIAAGVCQSDPLGKQCYLAYRETMRVPTHGKPANNVFLEYAPITRDLTRPIATQIDDVGALHLLLDFFGRQDATALDYWLDNSLLSEWKKPIQKFRLKPEILAQDIAFYQNRGFQIFTSFACFLGKDYVQENNDIPNISEYVDICRNICKLQEDIYKM